MKLELLLQEGERETRVDLEDFPAFIGRNPDCTIHLEDSMASRRHASIELRGKKLCLVDLDSANGTAVNGLRSRECFLDPGDEIRIGKAVILVQKISSGMIARPPRAAPEPRSLRLPPAYRIGIVLFLLLAGGSVAYYEISKPKEEAKPAEDTTVDRRREAERKLLALKSLAGTAPRITADLIDRAESLQSRYSDLIPPGGEDPFADFLLTLRSRQKMEISNRLLAFEESLQGLLESKKFGEALRRVEEETERLQRENLLTEETALKARESTERKIQEAYERTLKEVEQLENLERDEECIVLCEKAIGMFAGATSTERFQEKLRFLRSSVEAVAERKREREEKLARAAAEKSTEAAKVPPPTPAGIMAILADPISSGALKEKVIHFSGFEGNPVEVKESSTLVVRSPQGERAVPFDAVPEAAQLEMARAALTGEALLEAARFGYECGLPRESDGILWKYVTESKEFRGERQKKADEVLARARSLGRVPEGGFTYTPETGWEDGRQRADRELLIAAGKLSKAILSSASPEPLERSLKDLLVFLDDPKLSTRGRSEVRKVAIDSLAGLRVKLINRISAQLKRKGFADIRRASEELKGRRAAALKTIFDTSMYLPENHPNYPKGDVVNGQKAVDDAVAAVRELWEKAGSYAVTMDASTQKIAAMNQVIEQSFNEKLYVEPDKKGSEDLEEITNNLDRKIDLRRYAASRAEADLYKYNLKVEAYNGALQDPEISEQEKAHVKFLNDYREMMGLRRLVMDARLCHATRKHSAACSQAGRIWHNGPDGSPGSRAQAEGFPGGVAENVAMGYGNPKDIWTRGWYRASDHHRNALSAGHNCMGYGYAGTAGTQNFSNIGAPFR